MNNNYGRKIMTDKIALITDELTGKVLGYKADNISDCDTLTDKSNEQTIQQACYDGKDVYYINGQLQVRDKDESEYNNKRNALDYELSDVRRKIKQGITERNDVTELLQNESRLKQELLDLEMSRDEAMKKYLLDELNNTEYKYYCSICLIIRDESEYLKEWLDWHVGQGVEHFYIYDHGSKYPISEFVKTLDAELQSKITVHDFGGTHKFAQRDAYNDCLNRYKRESRWIGFIDADEMIRVKCGCTIPALLKNFESFAGLFMRWVVYDANGQTERSDKPLRERFTHVTPTDIDDGVGKTFLQAQLVQYMLTHNGYPYNGFDAVDENRTPIKTADARKYDSTADLVCVDHYYTKSYEEWKAKIGRGTCDPIFNRKYADFFLYNPDMEYCREDITAEQKYEVSEKI